MKLSISSLAKIDRFCTQKKIHSLSAKPVWKIFGVTTRLPLTCLEVKLMPCVTLTYVYAIRPRPCIALTCLYKEAITFLLFVPGDFPFMRKKKHPDVAYKSHEFFDVSLAPGFPGRSSGADAVDVRANDFILKDCLGRGATLDLQLARYRTHSLWFMRLCYNRCRLKT